jgi:hypothetical protein
MDQIRPLPLLQTPAGQIGRIKGVLSLPGKGIWLGKWHRFGRLVLNPLFVKTVSSTGLGTAQSFSVVIEVFPLLLAWRLRRISHAAPSA